MQATRAIVLGLAALAVAPGVLHAAPTVAQRRELGAIRRQVLKVPGLLRRRKGDEAQKTLNAAEARFNKLLAGDKKLLRDRSVLSIRRLLQTQKLRVRRALGKTPARPPATGTTGRKGITIPVGGKTSPFQMRYEEQRKAERERLTRDLGYWTRKASAKAKRAGALFHVAAINVRLRNRDAAQRALESLVKEFPRGEWTIAAQCRLIDLKIEHAFDLTWPQRELRTLIVWADTTDRRYVAELAKKKAEAQKNAKGKRGSTSTVRRAKPAGGGAGKAAKKEEAVVVPTFVLKPYTERQNVAAIFRRSALLDVLRGEITATTQARLLRAQRYAAPPNAGFPKDAAFYQRLLAQVRSRRPTTPPELRQSGRGTYSHLLYGDLLLSAGAFERTREHSSALLAHKKFRFTDLQKSYLHFQNGRAANALRDIKQRRRAAGDFASAVKLAPKSRWADKCLFLAANARWNHEHDAGAAIALWRRLLKDYPQSRDWDRAAYYVGVIYQQEKRYAEAKAAYESLLKEKPKTSFAKLTKEQLRQVDRELSRR